jgi:hypothetical protein
MLPGNKNREFGTARLNNGCDERQRLGAEQEILRSLMIDRRSRNASCSPSSMHQSLRNSRSAANPGECRRGEQVERVILIPLLALRERLNEPADPSGWWGKAESPRQGQDLSSWAYAAE